MTTIRIILLGSMASAAIALAGCATVEEAVAEQTTTTYTATLNGAQEPGGGDREGAGRAEISISDNFGQICYDLNDIRGIGPITGAHIHRGAPGVNGPVVFTLKPANEGGYKGSARAAPNGPRIASRTTPKRSTSTSTPPNSPRALSAASFAAEHPIPRRRARGQHARRSRKRHGQLFAATLR